MPWAMPRTAARPAGSRGCIRHPGVRETCTQADDPCGPNNLPSNDRTAPHLQRGVITKPVGGTRVAQLVSTALRTSKKSRTMLCAHALAAGDGLPDATCATLGISTMVAFGSVRATSGPNEGAVCASYCAEITSVGMLLSVTSRMARSTGGTFQTPQLERMNWRLGALPWIDGGKVGN